MQIEIPDEIIEKEIIGWAEPKVGQVLRYSDEINAMFCDAIVKKAKEILAGDTLDQKVEAALNKLINEKAESISRRHLSHEIKTIAEKSVQEKLSI